MSLITPPTLKPIPGVKLPQYGHPRFFCQRQDSDLPLINGTTCSIGAPSLALFAVLIRCLGKTKGPGKSPKPLFYLVGCHGIEPWTY